MIPAFYTAMTLVGLGVTAWLWQLPTWHYAPLRVPRVLDVPVTLDSDYRGMV